MNSLHFTETLKGLTYRLKRCEYILNASKFSFWHATFFTAFYEKKKCICIFVDDLVSSGRIHISVDEPVSLWTILSLLDGFISLRMNLYLCGQIRKFMQCSVPMWTNLYPW